MTRSVRPIPLAHIGAATRDREATEAALRAQVEREDIAFNLSPPLSRTDRIEIAAMMVAAALIGALLAIGGM